MHTRPHWHKRHHHHPKKTASEDQSNGYFAATPIKCVLAVCMIRVNNNHQRQTLALPGRVRCVRSVLVVARGRHGCVALLRRVRVEHDAPLGSFGAEWCRCRVCVCVCVCVGEALRVVWTAHEEQCVDGVLFCLLAGHAEDPRPWCCRHPRTVAEIAVVLLLAKS
jgi:hypothetical protein